MRRPFVEFRAKLLEIRREIERKRAKIVRFGAKIVKFLEIFKKFKIFFVINKTTENCIIGKILRKVNAFLVTNYKFD